MSNFFSNAISLRIAWARGVLAIPDEEMASLARSIRQELERLGTFPSPLPSD